MKNPALAVVSVAALVGAVSAGVISLWLAPEAPRADSRPAEGTSPASTAGDAELRREFARLALENQALARRVELLERRPIVTARDELAPALAGRVEDPAATGDDTRSMLLAAELPETVRAALEDIRAEEQAEEQRLLEEREAARREERLERWREVYGLSNAQVTDLRTWMIDSRSARQELERQRDASSDREAYRAARAAQRESDEANLQRILSPAQYQAWQEREARDDERGKRNERNGERRQN
ncbi:MAG: hypothetical protein ABL998_11115 [Planctomycetota bacterium]